MGGLLVVLREMEMVEEGDVVVGRGSVDAEGLG